MVSKLGKRKDQKPNNQFKKKKKEKKLEKTNEEKFGYQNLQNQSTQNKYKYRNNYNKCTLLNTSVKIHKISEGIKNKAQTYTVLKRYI